MQPSRRLLLAIGILAITGSAVLADVLPTAHHLVVRLPRGGTEQSSYTGDAAPRIVFLSDATEPLMVKPAAELWLPFAGLDRISADMHQMAAAIDRQMSVAMQELQFVSLAVQNDMTDATLRSFPAGAESYSFVSIMNGRNVCTREVQITSMGNSAKPKVVSYSSGNCGSWPAIANRSPDNVHVLQTGTRVPVEISVRSPHI